MSERENAAHHRKRGPQDGHGNGCGCGGMSSRLSSKEGEQRPATADAAEGMGRLRGDVATDEWQGRGGAAHHCGGGLRDGRDDGCGRRGACCCG